ncbi:zinc finger BED domain-containing protein RICESLEEPER 2-like [Diospyros lotus]|uniref:zinc finger BED domain-containing protein RICESLEEPER 2-like n=1 Tax=Diospyros lotus TaxID=55363 RepID=UPI0022522B54|nr:zinc finger BED domain-containing protein RICESLEEPER 2-like [Diospyros lotus]
MIIMHDYPLSMVEHSGFKDFTSTIQPLFKCPSRNTLKNDIMRIYSEERNKVMSLIENVDNRVAITTDMWTSSNQKMGFMAVTTLFIDKSWTLHSKILRFIYVPCPHTSDVLTNVLIDVMLGWNVDSRLSTITVDNCSTSDSMIGKIKAKLNVGLFLNGGSLLHMRCSAHILNLIVKIGLDVIKHAIDNVRESVVFWTVSPKRIEKFEDVCQQMKVPYAKRLCLDCPTRWNSTYLMLKTALVYKSVFPRFKLFESQYKNVLSDMDWETAKDVRDRLELFYNVTELFPGTKYPTANIYFSIICKVKLTLNEWVKSRNEVISTMAKSMSDKFNAYWNVIHKLMGVAVVLDPWCKMTFLDFYSPKRKTTKVISFRTELDLYLDEDVIVDNDQFDILLWWKMNGVKYPTLQTIARDILAILVSTIVTESAFSSSGETSESLS